MKALLISLILLNRPQEKFAFAGVIASKCRAKGGYLFPRRVFAENEP